MQKPQTWVCGFRIKKKRRGKMKKRKITYFIYIIIGNYEERKGINIKIL